jgi:hypothetical protein
VRPHTEHLDDALVLQNLVAQPVLDGDAPREGAVEVADEFLERRRGLKRVYLEDGEDLLGLRLQTGGDELLRILARLLRVEPRALLRLPVICTGSCDAETSSRSL